ncbi:hypothetical protein Poli38472_005153 [Pythium oligandrum]|uniref:N-acetyltransferase domain-containing protein n=1 Tax=Pythium oligandrum TaxID=41045 RepID=A0A8K1FGA1_PYTOL|nr:hypothetical protein Poli38472_005153 [Pythium oligandrum]|eukprot:TMW62535.1 hypothetical protein Poli38472_005153 [Pythium oligandrum]
MLDNAGLVIIGEKVTLVPYESEHVAKYHEWMKDPWLQEMTASEPLSFEEEYAMQATWRNDPKKCTFIVLEKGTADTVDSFVDGPAIERMAGDVNLFFNDDEDPTVCEMEIMIAEPKYRRKGFAREAVRLMMAYATSELKVTRFYCKIHESNSASLQLFNSLDYKECNYVKAFEEYELELFPLNDRTRIVDEVLSSAVLHRTPPSATN